MIWSQFSHIALPKMGSRIIFPSKIFSFLSKFFKTSTRNSSCPTKLIGKNSSHHHFVLESQESISNSILVFHFESAVLRSTSLFPYFMLVAFEAGGLLRFLLLFLSYPLVWLAGEHHMGLKIMVFLSFFGIKKDTFRIGSSVLPKFFLEDVGCEGFESVASFRRKVATSNMPRIMVENFLNEYLGAETVVAGELKSSCGYFLGLMEDKLQVNKALLEELEENKATHNVVGITGQKYVDQQVFSHCQEAHYVSDSAKRNWSALPRERYPKPLIFHDGRLAFRPTFSSSLAMFMWLPFGLFIFLIRFAAGSLLPLKTCGPIYALSGAKTTVSRTHNNNDHTQQDSTKPKGMLYVCNHRILLDPLFISYVLDKPVSTVTYSLSRFHELVAPIKTIRLTRDKDEDRKTMERLLSYGSLVVCPEGTTCREPYLLRFSPLFAELTDNIIPVGLDVKVTMFYGTTASGLKSLDALFQLLNPNPSHNVKILQRLRESSTCQAGGKSRVDVANHVQSEIGKALGFECTSFTRKDKYMILAGNEGLCRGREPGN